MKNDRVCDECGCIHKNGIDRHGRCYYCGGELIAWKAEDYELTAVTPGGIEIYYPKNSLSPNTK